MANEKTVSQNGSKDHVSTAFKWFHATSVNGGAMLIAAVLASYLSVYMTDTLMIPAATASRFPDHVYFYIVGCDQ